MNFVEQVAEEMTSFITKVNSGDKNVRFSPVILRIALSMWMKSPKAYKEYKASSPFCLPSIRTLQNYKQERSFMMEFVLRFMRDIKSNETKLWKLVISCAMR